uniref:Uncharacterized protein n=1 Tax=Felis catus TaxID=9685 RepID=A0ABI7ZU63_FELCA
MPPKFKCHLNDDDVTGSVKSEGRNLLEEDSDEEEYFFLKGPSEPRFRPRSDTIKFFSHYNCFAIAFVISTCLWV